MKLIVVTAIIAISSLAASGNATADPFEEFVLLLQNADTTRAIEIAQCSGVINAFAMTKAANKYGADFVNHPERNDEIPEYPLALSFSVVAQFEYSGAFDTDGEEATRRVHAHIDSNVDATLNALKTEDDAFLQRTTEKCTAHMEYVAAIQKVIDEMEGWEETPAK